MLRKLLNATHDASFRSPKLNTFFDLESGRLLLDILWVYREIEIMHQEKNKMVNQQILTCKFSNFG